MNRPEIKERVQAMRRLAVAPSLRAALGADAVAPRPDAGRLAMWVQIEPAVAARVLGAAALDGFADLDSGLAGAAGRLETERLLGLMLDLLAEADPEEGADSPAEAELDYAHALACAACAEQIALRLDASFGCSPKLAFAAGLLHDIGKLALARADSEAWRGAVAAARRHGVSLAEAERRALGVDHAVAGKWLAEAWGMPAPIVDVIWLHHHNVAHLDRAFPVALLDVVAVANALSHGGAIACERHLPGEAIRRLSLKDSDLASACEVASKARDESLAAALAPCAQRPHPIDFREGAFLSLAAIQAERAQLRHEIRRLDALCQLARALGPARTLDEVLEGVARALIQGVRVAPGLCGAHGASERTLLLRTWKTIDGPTHASTIEMNGEGPEANRPRTADPWEAARRLGMAPDAAEAAANVRHAGGVVAVPIAEAGSVHGQIILDIAQGQAHLSRRDWNYVLAVAGAAGEAMGRLRAEGGQHHRMEALAESLYAAQAQANAPRKGGQASVPEPSHEASDVTPSQAEVRLAEGIVRALHVPVAQVAARVQQRLRETPDDAVEAAPLRAMLEQSRRAQKVLADLAALARRAPLRRQPTHVNTVLQGLIRPVQHRLLAKGIRLVEDYTEDLPRLPLDPSQMSTAFTKVLENAHHACSARGGGRITVRTEAAPGQAGVVVRVTDTGPGVPARVLPHVFEPFFTTSTAPGSAGLGLALCRRIIEEHGGSVTLESTEGQGAAVLITLPTTVPRARAQEGADARARKAPHTRTVLIVDDDAHVREVLRETLVRRGFSVKTASDGLEALETISADGIDLVLLDLQMRGAAFSVLTELQERGAPPPVIVMTEPGAMEAAEEALRRGARACLRKPFELARLLAEVEVACANAYIGARG